jgi:long-chain acyl-CoA synthetase
MYLADHARLSPGKPAMIIPGRGEVTFAQLEARSNQLAHLLHDRGLRRGDHIAVFMENHLMFMDAVWAAFRSGLQVTAINRYLPAEEAAYIATDCMAKALITSRHQAAVAGELLPMIADCPIRLMTDEATEEFESYEAAIAAYPGAPLDQEWMGGSMLYSSGTTGRPKGIVRPLADHGPAEGFVLRQALNR